MNKNLTVFTDQELYNEIERRHTIRQLLEYRNGNYNGFTPKDVVCVKGSALDYFDEQEGGRDLYGPYYYFYLRVDGKLFDLYYQNCATSINSEQDVKPSRWPEGNDAINLVPLAFTEASENTYNYHRDEPVEECLKEHGVEFRVWNVSLYDEETGLDKNYEG